ncbi:unnamed protein product [Tilletia controversa]|nr:unnamed protein product [Tilletia controversa]
MSVSLSSSSPSQSRAHSLPPVDLVLVFKLDPKPKAKTPLPKLSTQQRTAISTQYANLLDRIDSVGLQHTSRVVDAGSTILIFVHAPQSTLLAAKKLHSLSDFLHGVKPTFDHHLVIPRKSSLVSAAKHASPDAPITVDATPADRLRLVHDLLTLPTSRPKPLDGGHGDQSASGTGIALANAAGSGLPAHTLTGAGICPGLDPFPNLTDITPLHDDSFNREWMKLIQTPRLYLPAVELDKVRAHFGEELALYFAWLSHYATGLTPMAAVGFSFWYFAAPYAPLYSIFLVGWAAVLVETWRMREKRLAVRWGVAGCNRADNRRLGFKPRLVRTHPATGEIEEVFEWWRVELRIALVSLPSILIGAIVVGLTMSSMFISEVFVSKLYHGPGSFIVPYLPTIILMGILPQVMSTWNATAEKLTIFENHYDQRRHNFSMTLKLFCMQAITAYGALTLSAFVYVPFGEYLLNELIVRGFYSQALAQSAPRDPITGHPKVDFNINPDRLHKQLFAVSVTAQVVNAVTELALPFILRKVAEHRAARAARASAKNPESEKSEGAQAEDEREFMAKVKRELGLPNYDPFGDFAEMASQFGFVVLWSVIWPLNPVFAFVNNFFELRTDLLKICVNARRPVPVRTDSIGPWLEVLGFLSWLAAMSNAALVFLYRQSEDALSPGHSPYEFKWRTHIHGTPDAAAVHARHYDSSALVNAAEGLDGINANITQANLTGAAFATEPFSQSAFSLTRLLPSWLSQNGPTGALISALLIALASEHAYALFRSLVRHVLDRVLWRGSEEEMMLIKQAWEGRREAVLRAGMGGPGSGSGAGAGAGVAVDGGVGGNVPPPSLPGSIDLSAGEKVMKKISRADEEQTGFWDKSRDVGLAALQGSGKTEFGRGLLAAMGHDSTLQKRRSRRDSPASAEVFGIAELVQLIAEHVATQDLASFRLINRLASVYGGPHQFTFHCYPWSDSGALANLGSNGKGHLRHVRHIVIDTGVASWDSGGDDLPRRDTGLEGQLSRLCRPSEEEQQEFNLPRRETGGSEQWSRLFDLLQTPELTGVETVDIKGSVRWASQMEGLIQPSPGSPNLDSRLATSLRSLCLTGITETMDRHWNVSLARAWWSSISNLIERCVELQKARGEVMFRHLHIGVEGDATVMCGPPNADFNTTFRTHLLGNLESLTLGKVSYETSRGLLGPLDVPPTDQLSMQAHYEWPVWTCLRSLRITFGYRSDGATSRLCDHVLNHCPVLEELFLTLGPSQPILLHTRLATLRHLSIDVPELVMGAHIRNEEERERLQSFILAQKSLVSLSLNHVEVRDPTSGKFVDRVFSGLPPIEVSGQSLPKLRACTGNYVVFRPTRPSSLVRWEIKLPAKPLERSPKSDAADPPAEDALIRHLRSEIHALDTATITFLSICDSSEFRITNGVEALRTMCARGDFPRLTEVELKGSFSLPGDVGVGAQCDPFDSNIISVSQISTIRALQLIPTNKCTPPAKGIENSTTVTAQAMALAVEALKLPAEAIGFNLQYLSVGLELFDRVSISAPSSETLHGLIGFRRRIGRHHPLYARTLSRPSPRLAAWWGEEYKLRDKPDLVGFCDPFRSIMEHIDAPGLEPEVGPKENDTDAGTNHTGVLPVSRTLPSFRAARIG